MAQSGDQVKYVPFSSLVDTTFWHALSKKKLDELKLDDAPFEGRAFYRNDQADGLPALVTFDYQSLRTDDGLSTVNVYTIPVDIVITNTLEEFKKVDKQSLLQTYSNKLWQKMVNCTDGQLPNGLTRALLLTFLDLKKFIFYYWFAFPSFNWPNPSVLSPAKFASDVLTEKQLQMLNESLYSSQNQRWIKENPYFLICISKEPSPSEEAITLLPLRELKNVDAIENSKEVIYISFPDPSKNTEYPGWPLRNLIVYISLNYLHLRQLKVFCYRTTGRDVSCSLCFDLHFNHSNLPSSVPLAVGWEKNWEKGKFLPRTVDLRSVLDPVKLASNAVNLNLKLMRWRLVPSLNLQLIAKAKCLLLGSGTLGCNVARSLLAWGVEVITFVDNSKVSYSNPVRQSLFKFTDCLDGGKDKAMAAADALKEIYPNVQSKGINLSIPMPGHSVSKDREATIDANVKTLEQLVETHDVIFLLMDTRESRWLPTVLGQVHQKIVINAALGFDSYLVQRHGIRQACDQAQLHSSSSSSIKGAGSNLVRRRFIPGHELGCYYCSDVVAPGDSTRDRTLDQQCTVTRPGVSMMAGAMAVELLVSILQHPLQANAPASLTGNNEVETSSSYPSNGDGDEDECCLGIIPHQIRSFLSRFHDVIPATAAFANCSGCSKSIIDEYKSNGFKFLLKVFNEPGYLEEISGLKQLHDETHLEDVWALSDDDTDSSSYVS